MKTLTNRLARLFLLLCLLSVVRLTQAQVRTADEILKDLNAATMPPYNVNKDTPNTHYREEFLKKQREISMHRAELIGELLHSHPEHPSVAELVPERWETLFNLAEDYRTILDEANQFLKSKPDPVTARSAWQWRAMCTMQIYSRADGYDPDRFLAAIEDYVKQYPTDPQGPTMLYEAASFHILDNERSVSILRRIVSDWPKSGGAREARWKLRQADAVGKPFELEFEDAISGRHISIESLRGKIVVIDFWATWCPPCVAEMPHLKELYAKWQSQGVEFIGVSLDSPKDQGGLDDLKKFVSEHEITWPQYYQGQGWQSDFSTGWGIDSIPCLFVVDDQGNLAAANVGKKLEQTVDELIARRNGSVKAAEAGDGG